MKSLQTPTVPVPDESGALAVRVKLSVRITNFLAITIPFAGLGVAIYLLWGWGFHWLPMALMVGMYCVTILGVTLGYHRLFTHKSFQTHRVIQCILAIVGSMAVEGPVVKWVAMHRQHHQHSDHEGDPHSPHLHGSGVINTLRGLWHAHVGWMFQPDSTDLDRYVPDLRPDRMLSIIDQLFSVWVTLGLLIPALLGWVISGTWQGALLGFIWGGLVRILLVHQVTFSLNSVGHLWGSRPFRSHDHSTNNFIFAVVNMGEGWHNNHHAFPASARHGLKWWQIDVSYWIIVLMSMVGLAWKVRTPSPRSIASKRRG